MHVNDLLKTTVEAGASDLHLKVGTFPMMRVRGTLLPVTEEKRLDHEDVVAMSAAIMSTQQRQKFKETQEVDLAYSVAGLGRFRCNIFQQRGTVGLVLRVSSPQRPGILCSRPSTRSTRPKRSTASSRSFRRISRSRSACSWRAC